MRRIGAALAILIGIVAICESEAQDKPAPSFEVQASGQTRDEFQVEFRTNFELDRSSPKAVVESYLKLTDAPQMPAAAWHPAFRLVQKLVAEHEQGIKADLFTDNLRAISDPRSPDVGPSDTKRKYVDGPEQITQVADEVDGEVFVTTVTEDSVGSEDDFLGVLKFKRTRKYRCVMDDGKKWLIASIEQLRDGEEAWTKLKAAHERVKSSSVPAPRKLETDTPEGAAKSLYYTLILSSAQCEAELADRVTLQWREKVATLFSKPASAPPDDSLPAAKADELEITEIKDISEDVKHIYFNALPGREIRSVVFVERQDDSWRISGVGFLQYDRKARKDVVKVALGFVAVEVRCFSGLRPTRPDYFDLAD